MIRHILRSLRQRGVRFVFMYIRNAVWFDLRYGTNTAFRREKSVQAVDDPAFKDGLLYVASLDFVIKETISRALQILSSACGPVKFIDVGCGKGKTITYGEKYFSDDFEQFVGIEYDRSLVGLCEANLAKVKAIKTSVLAESGENFANYLEGPSVVYFYNSFQGDTFRRAFTAARDKSFVLIYVDPVLADDLVELGYVEAYAKNGQYNAEQWKIFKSPGLAGQ